MIKDLATKPSKTSKTFKIAKKRQTSEKVKRGGEAGNLNRLFLGLSLSPTGLLHF